MIRGDKFIISKQIGNILLHRPQGNVAEVKSFVDGKIIIKIDDRQYLLPIDTFSNYIIDKIKPTRAITAMSVNAAINRAPLIIEKVSPTPGTKPTPEPEPTPEPDNTIVTPSDPDKDLYDDEEYI